MKKLLLLILFIVLSCAPSPGAQQGTDTNQSYDQGRPDIPKPQDTTQPRDNGHPNTLPRITFINDKAFFTAARNAIMGAKNTIDITELEFRDGDYPDYLRYELINARKRGVRVRMLLEKLNYGANDNQYNALKKGGVQVIYRDMDLHAKTLVIDNTIVFVGSTNFSQSSLKYNHETDFRFNDTGIGAAFEKYFNALWSNQGTKAAPGSCYNGVSCFGDGQYYDRVGPVLRAAKHRIRMVMYQITQSTTASSFQHKMCQYLIDARKRGVDVRVVLERTDYKRDTNRDNATAAAMLKQGGVAVRFDPDTVITHAKLLVVDDQVVVSTNNWSKTGLKYNHEVGVIVKDARAVTDALAYFDTLWSQSR